MTAAQCYSPSEFRVAYGIQPLLDEGIDGRGETVVLLEFAAPVGSPPRVTDIRQDLARFDGVFGMPAASLQVINSLARSRLPWLATSEEVEDTEIVHAVAPDAAIREVLISDAATTRSADVAAALRLGLTQGAVISFSHSWGEQCFTAAEVAQLNAALQAANDAAVTVVNSSGDFGASANPCPGATSAFTGIRGVNLMASDPLVLAAGGSSLEANRTTGAYIGETVWSTPVQAPVASSAGSSSGSPSPVPVGPSGSPAASPSEQSVGIPSASGGGFSHLFSRPAYQGGVPGIGVNRGVPDVAADADPNTGAALVVTETGQNYMLTGADGTSAAAPLWAAVIALADQYAGRHLGFVNPAIYRIGRSAAYHTAFHDITSGTNTVQSTSQTVTGYQASRGWNPATGWGSPDAEALVPLLVRNAGQ